MSVSLRLTVFAVVTALLATGSTSVAVTAGQATTLRVAVVPGDGGSVLYYAKDLGYFEKNGLNVQITSMTNGGAIVAAVAGGALDVGESNAVSIAQARLNGLSFRFFASSAVAQAPNPMSAAIMVANDSPIRSGADANGKTFAITGLKNLTQIEAEAWVDKTGGDSKTLHFLEVPLSQMTAGLAAHRFDLAFVVEPFIVSAVTAKQARIVGNALDSFAPRYMTVGWFSSDSWLNAHADAAARFARSIQQAAVWGNGHERESAEILAKYTGLSLDLASKMGRTHFGTEIDTGMLRPVVSQAVKYGVLEAPVDADDLLWPISHSR